MSAFAVLCKKELTEYVRTYKGVVMFAVFVVLGIMNPMIAKLLPEIFNGNEIDGIIFNMPEPVAMDSWAQFFGNVGQIGVLTYVVVFCGITANDLGKGTLINILTKGIKRSYVVASKFAVAAALFAVSYAATVAITSVYNTFYWETEPLPHFALAMAAPYLYGLMLISLVTFGGILTKSFYGSLLAAGAVIVAMSLLNISPALAKYNPITLSGGTLSLLSGAKSPRDFFPAIIICASMTAGLIAASVVTFNRKQL